MKDNIKNFLEVRNAGEVTLLAIVLGLLFHAAGIQLGTLLAAVV